MEPYHGVQPQNLCLFCFTRLQIIKLPSEGQVFLPYSQLQWYYTTCIVMWTKFVLKAFFDIALSATTLVFHFLFTSVDFDHKISWKFICFFSLLSAWHKNKQMSSMSGSFLWSHIIKSFWETLISVFHVAANVDFFQRQMSAIIENSLVESGHFLFL